jgi:hypothetical protein
MARLSGGGIQGKNVTSVSVKPGKPTTNVISPRGVSELGRAVGDRLNREGSHTGVKDAQKVFQGTAPQVPSGNAAAASTVAGPGGSRQVYPSGFQSLHGDVVKGSTSNPGDWFVREFPGVPTAKGK